MVNPRGPILDTSPRDLKPAATSSIRSAEAAFTLIEVMIAAAILASMVSVIWASFSITTKGKERADKDMGRYHQLRLAMGRMAREISMAFLSNHEISGTSPRRTFFIGKRNHKVDHLRFSTFAHTRLRDDARECDQSAVSYYGKTDPADRSTTNLIRGETPRLATQESEEESAAMVMLEDIEELHFEYFDLKNKKWLDRWDTTSVSGQGGRLPAQIRIQVAIRDEKGRKLLFRTATRTNLADALWFSPQ